MRTCMMFWRTCRRCAESRGHKGHEVFATKVTKHTKTAKLLVIFVIFLKYVRPWPVAGAQTPVSTGPVRRARRKFFARSTPSSASE